MGNRGFFVREFGRVNVGHGALHGHLSPIRLAKSSI
jgi:hypothetical protein